MENLKLPQTLLDHAPWEKETNPIWMANSFSLRRNLTKSLFPSKLEEKQLPQTFNTLQAPLQACSLLDKPTLLKAEELGLFEKEFLSEHFLIEDSFHNSGQGQGFVVDQTGRFLVTLNWQDHLQIQLIDTQGGWEQAWNQLNKIESAISHSNEFAFSPKFGYLTADPSLCGTGLTVQAFLHVPALIHTEQLQETLLKQKEEGVSITGMGGQPNEWVGDLIVVSNAYTLGVNEENILNFVHSMAMKLMAAEKTVRSQLQTENNTAIKDQISRAYGLLLHSYQLQAKEALNALSLLKLGVHLDWISGITDTQLNTLFFQCRRAHLLHRLGASQLIDPQEVAHKRADYLHKHMQGICLKFESAA